MKMRVAGIVLMVAALFGFLIVADDFDHKGELLATSAVLLLGLVLLAGSFRERLQKN